MIAMSCSCPKCGIKYIMYIPDKFDKDRIDKLKTCGCGGKMKTKQIF